MEDYGMVDVMTKQEFADYLNDNMEIFYKNLNAGISEIGTGDKITYKLVKHTDDGETPINKTTYKELDKAIDALATYLVKYAETHNDDGSEVQKKATTKKEAAESFNGPRIIKVFGQTKYIETNTNTTLKEIVQNLKENYGLPHFNKDNFTYFFDDTTGVLEISLKFNSKG